MSKEEQEADEIKRKVMAYSLRPTLENELSLVDYMTFMRNKYIQDHQPVT
jgi:hypothetical protein